MEYMKKTKNLRQKKLKRTTTFTSFINFMQKRVFAIFVL